MDPVAIPDLQQRLRLHVLTRFRLHVLPPSSRSHTGSSHMAKTALNNIPFKSGAIQCQSTSAIGLTQCVFNLVRFFFTFAVRTRPMRIYANWMRIRCPVWTGSKKPIHTANWIECTFKPVRVNAHLKQFNSLLCFHTIANLQCKVVFVMWPLRQHCISITVQAVPAKIEILLSILVQFRVTPSSWLWTFARLHMLTKVPVCSFIQPTVFYLNEYPWAHVSINWFIVVQTYKWCVYHMTAGENPLRTASNWIETTSWSGLEANQFESNLNATNVHWTGLNTHWVCSVNGPLNIRAVFKTQITTIRQKVVRVKGRLSKAIQL